MFLKPYKVKNSVPLKGSDTKKLRQRVKEEYPDVNVDLIFAPKASINILKLLTHRGFQTNVYCVDKLPMFFENEDNKLVPTLYSLWQVADLLPYFTTFTDVLPKLSNGADLMLRGVIPQGTGMNIYGHHKQGQIVAINLTTNKSAVGVGYLPHSSDDLYMCGGYGVAVKILHLFGDKLWSLEPTLTKQIPQLKNQTLTDSDFPALGSKVINKKENQLKREDEQLLENAEILSDQLNDQLQISEISAADHETNNESQNLDEKPKDTPEDLLKYAFLSALKSNGKNLELPLLTSNFYRLYVVPEFEEPFELKKTKYKKLSNFLNEMIDEGFIVVREETKGVDKIVAIDLEHPELVNFIVDLKKAKSSATNLTENPLFHSELTELYMITDVVAPFFTKLDYKRGSGIPLMQIKKDIREYIRKKNFPVSKCSVGSDKTYILDECLENICNTKTAPLSRIIKDVISKMDHSYQMCSANEYKGNKPLIQMSLATRSGNKKVTLVSNIECYGIIMAEFMKLCKQGAAASTSIFSPPHQSREMLQIQGNQVRFIYNLLTETYKIPPRCILGLELAKDGKKHKNK